MIRWMVWGAMPSVMARRVAGIDPPNSPVTLSGGWIYNRVAKKGVLVKPKNGSTPLKDTGALYSDFDYEITER